MLKNHPRKISTLTITRRPQADADEGVAEAAGVGPPGADLRGGEALDGHCDGLWWSPCPLGW